MDKSKCLSRQVGDELGLLRSRILIVCDVLGRYVKESLEYRSYWQRYTSSNLRWWGWQFFAEFLTFAKPPLSVLTLCPNHFITKSCTLCLLYTVIGSKSNSLLLVKLHCFSHLLSLRKSPSNWSKKMPTMISFLRKNKKEHRLIDYMFLVIMVLITHLKKCACVRVNYFCAFSDSLRSRDQQKLTETLDGRLICWIYRSMPLASSRTVSLPSNQSAFLCFLTFYRLQGSSPPLRRRCSSTALNMLGVASSRVAALIAGMTSAHMPELKAEDSSHMLRTNWHQLLLIQSIISLANRNYF